MRHVLAPVRNVVTLNAAYEQVLNRDAHTPGILLIHGQTGSGKSTALASLATKYRALYLRAQACWTTSAVLHALAKEACVPSQGLRNAQILEGLIQKLSEEQRPVFVDEGDYLLSNSKMLETLRDLHDMTSVPLVVVGMDDFERRILTRPQFARRVLERVEFKPCDLKDTQTLIHAVCECRMDDALVKKIHKTAKGSIGLMTVALARIEYFARVNGLKEVTAAAWGTRDLFLSKGAA
jgi:DNA transposition AAA+ family ATPase